MPKGMAFDGFFIGLNGISLVVTGLKRLISMTKLCHRKHLIANGILSVFHAKCEKQNIFRFRFVLNHFDMF